MFKILYSIIFCNIHKSQMLVTCVERGLEISKSPAFVAEDGNTLENLILSNKISNT